MAGPLPFLFCRYELTVDDEPLAAHAQLTSLKELQGNFYPHGPKAEKEGLFDSVVMRPRSFMLDDGHLVLTWSIGQQIGQRRSVKYNDREDELAHAYLKDDSLKYADFVAVPSLGVLAIDDRLGDTHMGGRAAANRFRSVFRQLDGADASILAAADYRDIQKALEDWKITTFNFTVKPVNPHAPSALAGKMDKALRARNVAKALGTWEAEPGEGIKPDDEMRAIVDLSDAGYGQIALKGETEEGHVAQIKKPPFSNEKSKNLQAAERPREMRVLLQTTETPAEKEVFRQVAKLLVKFYGN